jgi:hypothetical protein
VRPSRASSSSSSSSPPSSPCLSDGLSRAPANKKSLPPSPGEAQTSHLDTHRIAPREKGHGTVKQAGHHGCQP